MILLIMEGSHYNKNFIKSILTIQCIKNNYREKWFVENNISKIHFSILSQILAKDRFSEKLVPFNTLYTHYTLRFSVLNDNVIKKI